MILRTFLTTTFIPVLLPLVILTNPCDADDNQSPGSSASNRHSETTPLMPYAEFKAVTDAVNAKLASITERDSKKSAEEMLAFLKTQSAFEEVGMADDYSSLWARFRDGELLTIPNNQFAPAPQNAQRTNSTQGTASMTGGIR